MSLSESIQEHIDKLHVNSETLEKIINGPESGENSDVSLPLGGQQITVSKAIAQLIASSNSTAASLAATAQVAAQDAITQASTAAAAAAAAAASIADVSGYIFQRAVFTVQKGFDDFGANLPYTLITIGDLGIFFAPDQEVQSPNFHSGFPSSPGRHTVIGITGDDPDTQHTVAQMIVGLINGNDLDNQNGLSYYIDDFDTLPGLHARYLGATGPQGAYGQFEITYVGATEIALSASPNIGLFDVTTIGRAQANPFMLKNGDVLTTTEKALVRTSIFGHSDNIDVDGALTTGPQDRVDPESVYNRTQLEDEIFSRRDMVSFHSIGGYTPLIENNASYFNEGAGAGFMVDGATSQVAILLQDYFAAGRGNGQSSRFDFFDTRIGFAVQRSLADDTEIFVALAANSVIGNSAPAETDKGLFVSIRRVGGQDYVDIYMHDGTSVGNRQSVGNAYPGLNLQRMNRFEVRTFRTGLVQVWFRSETTSPPSLLAQLNGLSFRNLGSTNRRAYLGFRSIGRTTNYTIGVRNVTTSY